MGSKEIQFFLLPSFPSSPAPSSVRLPQAHSAQSGESGASRLGESPRTLPPGASGFCKDWSLTSWVFAEGRKGGSGDPLAFQLLASGEAELGLLRRALSMSRGIHLQKNGEPGLCEPEDSGAGRHLRDPGAQRLLSLEVRDQCPSETCHHPTPAMTSYVPGWALARRVARGTAAALWRPRALMLSWGPSKPLGRGGSGSRKSCCKIAAPPSRAGAGVWGGQWVWGLASRKPCPKAEEPQWGAPSPPPIRRFPLCPRPEAAQGPDLAPLPASFRALVAVYPEYPGLMPFWRF